MDKLYNFVYWVHAVLSVCFAQQSAVCSIAKIEGSLSQVTIFFLSPKLSSTKCNSLLPHFFLFQVLLLYIKLAISSLLHFFAKPFLFVSFAKLLLRVFNWHPSISYFFFAKLFSFLQFFPFSFKFLSAMFIPGQIQTG